MECGTRCLGGTLAHEGLPSSLGLQPSKTAWNRDVWCASTLQSSAGSTPSKPEWNQGVRGAIALQPDAVAVHELP